MPTLTAAEVPESMRQLVELLRTHRISYSTISAVASQLSGSLVQPATARSVALDGSAPRGAQDVQMMLSDLCKDTSVVFVMRLRCFKDSLPLESYDFVKIGSALMELRSFREEFGVNASISGCLGFFGDKPADFDSRTAALARSTKLLLSRLKESHELELISVCHSNESRLRVAHRFPEVVNFDSTYSTNCYDYPVAFVIGVDGERKSANWMTILMRDESTVSCNWVFSTTLPLMLGATTHSIHLVMTDQDKQFGAAVESAKIHGHLNPHLLHLFCYWHAISAPFAKLPNEHFIKSVISRWVASLGLRVESESEFNESLKRLQSYLADLRTNAQITPALHEAIIDWLSVALSKRDYWAKYRRRGITHLNITTTAHSEAENSAMKRSGGKLKLSLRELFRSETARLEFRGNMREFSKWKHMMTALSPRGSLGLNDAQQQISGQLTHFALKQLKFEVGRSHHQTVHWDSEHSRFFVSSTMPDCDCPIDGNCTCIQSDIQEYQREASGLLRDAIAGTAEPDVSVVNAAAAALPYGYSRVYQPRASPIPRFARVRVVALHDGRLFCSCARFYALRMVCSHVLAINQGMLVRSDIPLRNWADYQAGVYDAHPQLFPRPIFDPVLAPSLHVEPSSHQIISIADLDAEEESGDANIVTAALSDDDGDETEGGGRVSNQEGSVCGTTSSRHERYARAHLVFDNLFKLTMKYFGSGNGFDEAMIMAGNWATQLEQHRRILNRSFVDGVARASSQTSIIEPANHRSSDSQNDSRNLDDDDDEDGSDSMQLTQVQPAVYDMSSTTRSNRRFRGSHEKRSSSAGQGAQMSTFGMSHRFSTRSQARLPNVNA